MVKASKLNTLEYEEDLCIDCGMCSTVCPHGVFVASERVAVLARPDACMECGACQLNCPTGAIRVENGVGCASAMMYAALTGRQDVACSDESCCS